MENTKTTKMAFKGCGKKGWKANKRAKTDARYKRTERRCNFTAERLNMRPLSYYQFTLVAFKSNEHGTAVAASNQRSQQWDVYIRE